MRAAALALALLLAAPPGAAGAAGSPIEAALERDRGRTTLGIPLHDSGRGVMIEVNSRTRLGSIEILFEDGEIERMNLDRQHTCGRGLYEVARFGAERRVILVRFSARSCTGLARFRVLLARGTPSAG